jgi:protein-L-isoaspartate(D-aspartate) O-methyltransferase
MTSPAEKSWYAIMRYRMVEAQLRDRGITDERVLGAMLRVPRHEFIWEAYRGQAYEDHPIPIAEGQTISQPYIVALMLQALELTAQDKVLEVGTGSGYVTALLAELTAQVISIERHAKLAQGARKVLAELGYANVKVIVGDGSQGFPPSAPYDAILVSAAAFEIPPALVCQLADNGRMILPVGSPDAQRLQLLRMRNGVPEISLREPCRFVPLVSDVQKAEA